MKTKIEKNEFSEYQKRVQNYLETFRLLRDREPSGLEEILDWTPSTQVYIISKTIKYNLHDPEEAIKKQISEQCENIIADALNNKKVYCIKPKFPDDYIKDEKGKHIRNVKQFKLWDKIIRIYIRYKHSKNDLKSDIEWFKVNFKLRNVSEVLSYVKFTERLIDAANLSPDSFYSAASIPFTSEKTRKPFIGKRTKKHSTGL